MTNATLQNDKVMIPARDLADLIAGAMTVQDKDAPTSITGLELSADKNTFMVRATDRYRMVIGTTRAIREITESDPGDLAPIALSWADAKQILAFLKSEKIAGILITHRDGEITFRGMSGSVTVRNWDMFKLPDFAPILSKAAGDPVPAGQIKVSAKLLAELGKIPHDISKGMDLSFHGENQPIKVTLSHDLIAWDVLIMPMRKR
jgi:hypothetical protein